jgi:hypothetical protein
MIEYALLIMLGFCTAGLIAFLLAPTLYRRAVRLTTKRLEATMPMTLSEIEADKDLLRASYAIKIRRLEAGLNKARDKSANQLVEISKHQVRIAELNQKIAEVNTELEERRNAANVFESTIRKRFPELETMLATASAALDERAAEIADLGVKLRRREEALDMAQRSVTLQQEEIRNLRDALERTGADTTGRFKKRPSQWSLDEYRSEYDRLNVELSKMREQLILAQDREKRQIAVLKTELQQLAERIMANAAAERTGEIGESDRAGARSETLPSRPPAPPRGPAAQPPVNPRPWTGGPARASRFSGRVANEPVQANSPEPPLSNPPPARGAPPEAKPAQAPAPQSPASVQVSLDRPVVAKAPVSNPAVASGDEAARNALKSLLDRGSRLAGKELFEKTEKAAQGIASTGDSGMDKADAAAAAEAVVKQVMAGQQPADRASPERAAPSISADPVHQEPAKPEPQLDRVFREIIEGRPAAPAASAPVVVETVGAETVSAATGERAEPAPGKAESSESSKTKTLLDRLRHIQERQTG